MRSLLALLAALAVCLLLGALLALGGLRSTLPEE